MAEGKASVVIYADLIHTVKKMPKEKAGELFLTILEYINDLNPVIDDLLIEVAFEPIKQQMKRDLKKWEAIKDKRSEAGKASAEAKKLAKENEQTSTKSTSVEIVKQTSTKSTVNVNGNVTVNGNVNETEIIKSIMDFFNFSETANFNKMRETGTFVKLLIHQGEIQKFIIQFEAYKKIKLKDPKFTHAFKNFIGTAKETYLDGAWNEENWVAKFTKSIPKAEFNF